LKSPFPSPRGPKPRPKPDFKKCPRCGRTLAFTPENFYRNAHLRHGLGVYCKQCKEAICKENRKPYTDSTNHNVLIVLSLFRDYRSAAFHGPRTETDGQLLIAGAIYQFCSSTEYWGLDIKRFISKALN
jgi:hypothetical protein